MNISIILTNIVNQKEAIPFHDGKSNIKSFLNYRYGTLNKYKNDAAFLLTMRHIVPNKTNIIGKLKFKTIFKIDFKMY